MSASFRSKRLLCCGVVFFQLPSKAFLAAATARSTSSSVPSQTEQMTSSVEGLMTSIFFLSWPSTHSLLMNLVKGQYVGWLKRGVYQSANGGLQSDGLLVCARDGRMELCEQ